jgi:hypothetical protein
VPTAGTLVVVPAFGEVKHVNDQVVVTLAIEEQDKDKAAAASRVNTKMKQGLEIVKKKIPSQPENAGLLHLPGVSGSACCRTASRSSSACRPHGVWASIWK